MGSERTGGLSFISILNRNDRPAAPGVSTRDRVWALGVAPCPEAQPRPIRSEPGETIKGRRDDHGDASPATYAWRICVCVTLTSVPA